MSLPQTSTDSKMSLSQTLDFALIMKFIEMKRVSLTVGADDV